MVLGAAHATQGLAPTSVGSGPTHPWPDAARLVLTTRYALLDQLAEHADLPVVVVSAPAGSGKSVLMAQWGARDARPHRTVRLKPWQDSPGAVVELVLDQLDDLGPSTVEVRSVVSDVEPRLSATMLPALAEVLATRTEPFVLVLDDIHLLREPRCAMLLESLCDAVPPGSQIVLVSRSETPEWLGRGRAEGRLLELSPSDLAFTRDEVDSFVRDQGLSLAPEIVSNLAARTEGWPVGLYLAARSVEEVGLPNDGQDQLRGIGAERSIRDYLRSQVLAHLDDDERSFLRRTSLFEVVSPALCDAVLDRDDSATVLATVSRQIQLIVPLDRAGTSYRYHHLLGEALAADLAEHDASSVAGLHRRAAPWYLRQGDVDEAIRHAVDSGDLTFAGQMLFAAVPLAVGIGNPDRLGRWLALLSESDVAADRWLTLSACWLAIMTGDDPDAVTLWLLRSQGHAGRQWREDAATDDYAANVAVVSMIAGRDGIEGTALLAARARGGLRPDSPFLAPTLFIAAVTAGVSGRDEESRRFCDQGLEIARSFGVASAEAYLLSWHALTALRTGDTATSIAVSEQVAVLVRERHLERLGTSGFAMSVLAAALCAAGRPDDARAALGAARRLTLRMRAITPWFSVLGPVLQARCSIQLGDLAGARLLLAEARAHLSDDLRTTWVAELADDTDRLLTTVPAQIGRGTTLTAAEMRVLQFMPTHLTYPQVGTHLFLSANTVKTHALSIYRKLGVTSRDQAVAERPIAGPARDRPYALISRHRRPVPPRRWPRRPRTGARRHPAGRRSRGGRPPRAPRGP